MPTPPTSPKTSIILAGGVAKGAFGAGALEVVADAGLEVAQLVGASSGALNAVVHAAGVRAGRAADATRALTAAWEDEGGWGHVFDVSILDIVRGRGVSTPDKVLDLLRQLVEPLVAAPLSPAGARAVELRMVLTAADGAVGDIGGVPATRFESVLAFDERDFADPVARERLYTVAVASSAFPVVFSPVDVPGVGRCLDGAIVNDTPVKLALESGARRILVIAPYPVLLGEEGRGGGDHPISQLADMLIHERLYRDLHEAAAVNATLRTIEGWVAAGRLTPALRDELVAALGWTGIVDIIDIRPPRALASNAFAGFFSKELRREYIAAGREAARAALAAAGLGSASS